MEGLTMKRDKRKKTLAQKRAVKSNRMTRSGEKSNYAKKREFLSRNGGWGFEYAEKPWK